LRQDDARTQTSHQWQDGGGAVAPRDLVLGVMGGWDVHTGILADILNGVEPRPFWSTHAKLESAYAARA